MFHQELSLSSNESSELKAAMETTVAAATNPYKK
jgi:hypothetical protein